MRGMVFSASVAFLVSAAGAQTADSAHNPAIKDGSPAATSSPASGANSFTEDQAKGRFEKAGYTSVSDLAKDEHGVWRGTAVKHGKKVKVGLDYKGNLTTN